MGFLAYLLPPEIIFFNDTIYDPTFIEKKYYFILDKIDINYVTVDDTEKVTLHVILNIYDSYEERLSRNNTFMTLDFSIQDLIDKNFSGNLWNKCYIKIKELLLNQNTQSLRESLILRGIDTIPSQKSYLLEIDDHF